MAEFDDILEEHATTFRLIHNPPRTDVIPEGKNDLDFGQKGTLRKFSLKCLQVIKIKVTSLP